MPWQKVQPHDRRQPHFLNSPYSRPGRVDFDSRSVYASFPVWRREKRQGHYGIARSRSPKGSYDTMTRRRTDWVSRWSVCKTIWVKWLIILGRRLYIIIFHVPAPCRIFTMNRFRDKMCYQLTECGSAIGCGIELRTIHSGCAMLQKIVRNLY